jgi:hypothetical protein
MSLRPTALESTNNTLFTIGRMIIDLNLDLHVKRAICVPMRPQYKIHHGPRGYDQRFNR